MPPHCPKIGAALLVGAGAEMAVEVVRIVVVLEAGADVAEVLDTIVEVAEVLDTIVDVEVAVGAGAAPEASP